MLNRRLITRFLYLYIPYSGRYNRRVLRWVSPLKAWRAAVGMERSVLRAEAMVTAYRHYKASPAASLVTGRASLNHLAAQFLYQYVDPACGTRPALRWISPIKAFRAARQAERLQRFYDATHDARPYRRAESATPATLGVAVY